MYGLPRRHATQEQSAAMLRKLTKKVAAFEAEAAASKEKAEDHEQLLRNIRKLEDEAEKAAVQTTAGVRIAFGLATLRSWDVWYWSADSCYLNASYIACCFLVPMSASYYTFGIGPRLCFHANSAKNCPKDVARFAFNPRCRADGK
jgi:hypothetical protein